MRATQPGALEALRALLPPAFREEPLAEVDRLYSLVVGGADPEHPRVQRFTLAYGDAFRLARTRRLSEALEAIESDLHRYVAEQAEGPVFVHAGVVALRGAALVLPGPSHAGKSSLVAALLRHGATYFSDEYAVLDDQGWVHPYPVPLSLRGRPDVGATRTPAASLGFPVGTQPLPVALIALSTYREGSRWAPRVLAESQAALGLVANAVAIRRNPRSVLPVLARVVRGARALEGERGEADDAARALVEALHALRGGAPAVL